jgi:hypothetical protein
MHHRRQHQLALPLVPSGSDEGAMRAAHRSARLRVPFEVALRDRALEICLRCFAEARRKRSR